MTDRRLARHEALVRSRKQARTTWVLRAIATLALVPVVVFGAIALVPFVDAIAALVFVGFSAVAFLVSGAMEYRRSTSGLKECQFLPQLPTARVVKR